MSINVSPDSPVELRRYLLGLMPDAEAAALEERYFGDAGLVDTIRAVEEGLIDDHLDGRLTAEERAAFERHYLASDIHRARLSTALALRRRTAAVPHWINTSAGRLAIAAAIVLVVGGTIWVARSPSPGAPRQARDITLATEPARDVPPVTPAVEGSGKPPASLIVAFTIPALVTRGGEQTTLAVPRDATHVLLRLEGEAPAARPVMIEVRTVEGRVAWKGRGEAAGPGLLTVARVPADRFSPDDYFAIVSSGAPGGAELWRYSFRIKPR